MPSLIRASTAHRRIIVMIAGLIGLIGLLPLGGAAAPSEAFFDTSFGDFAAELELARDEGKTGILLFFEQEECPFCRRMKETVFNREAVQSYFGEHFLVFPVDIEGDIEIVNFRGQSMKEKEFAFRLNRVRATPVFAFYDRSGERIVRYIGPTADAEEFLTLGRYVVEGHYETMPFIRYKRQADE